MTINISQPLDLPCGVSIPNRLCKSAMTEGLADIHDNPTQKLNHLYQIWSEGGAGLLITGNVMVDKRYLERVGNVVLESDAMLDEWQTFATAGTANGNQFWMQINHPGRQCTKLVASEPLAPSVSQLKIAGMFGKPRAMTEADIQDVIQRFVTTATLAKQAGFTGVQIHAAHGYLLSQFLSPHINKRDDRWGGSLENRARLLLTIVAKVRESVGDNFPVCVKLNSSDFQKGGFSLDDCIQVAQWLGEANTDLLEISGGTYENIVFLDSDDRKTDIINSEEKRESTKKREAFFLEYAEAISNAAQVPLMITGGFRTVQGMESALMEGHTQMIGLARPFCVEPDFPTKILNGTLQELPRSEANLSFGTGIFSRHSKNDMIRSLGSQGEAGWYYNQILRLGEGKAPEPGLSLLKALLTHFWRDMRNNQKRKRLLKGA